MKANGSPLDRLMIDILDSSVKHIVWVREAGDSEFASREQEEGQEGGKLAKFATFFCGGGMGSNYFHSPCDDPVSPRERARARRREREKVNTSFLDRMIDRYKYKLK